jgi:hypothetical protein
MNTRTLLWAGALLALLALPVAQAADEGAPGGCRSDVQKFCKEVKPGGGRMMRCLKRNETELSPQCRDRMAEGRQKMEVFAEACRPDAEKLCKDAAGGKGRGMRCLLDNKDRLSPACREQVAKVEARHPCMEDARRLCQGVKPGEGRMAQCLKRHEGELAASCKAHVGAHPRSAPGEEGG